MAITRTHRQSDESAQHSLAAQLLQPLLAKRRPERILVLKHPDSGDLQLETAGSAQVIRLSSDGSATGNIPRCRLTALPFEEAAFDLVILHHLVVDGGEPFMDEALRVMAAGGDVVVSGLNSSGLRNRFANRKRRLPALKLDRVCNYLKSRSFRIETCLLMGLGGFSKPAATGLWHGLGLPFADRVVLHGHHQSNMKQASILRFKQVQPAGLASAAIDGCSSREAVS